MDGATYSNIKIHFMGGGTFNSNLNDLKYEQYHEEA